MSDEVQKPIRTRIAPSPTGYPHIGTIYQAMFDYVFVHQNNGQFVVRIEDTDRARFVEGAEEVVFQSLDWFGLVEDESPRKGGPYQPYRQSERLETYKKYVDQLLEQKDAYRCFCTKERLEQMRQEQEAKHQAPMYDKHCRNLSQEEIEKNLNEQKSFVVRMKVPEDRESIEFEDLILGKIVFKLNQIDDQVILKSDGFPTYHLAVVVDDYLMKISHIFRGQEWVPSTPKHILLYQYLKWTDSIPTYVHLPVILNTDGGGKLSKRHGHASVDYYKSEGYLPEAILNYLSNIIWNHPEGKEIYSLEEFQQNFKLEDLKKASQGPRFDLHKLDWVNGEWLRSLTVDDLAKRLKEYLVDHPSLKRLEELTPLVKERMKKLSDFIPLTSWMFEEIEYDQEFFAKTKVSDPAAVLQQVLEKLESFEKPWIKEIFEQTFQDLAKELGLNNTQMFQLIRVAVSGGLITPPLFESLEIMGEDKVIERVTTAIKFLQK